MTKPIDPGDVSKQIDEWPESWAIGSEDTVIGAEICSVMRPFVDTLLKSSLNPKTIKRHINNLWSLGGELIADVNVDCGNRNFEARALIFEAIENEGGPLLRDATETMQRSFDGTCSKFFRYLEGDSDPTK